ncbi:MAG: WD40/YVTN/BNR-like repeat-containing protein, partial [Candidatus Kapaibacterium sp.]
QKYYSDSAYGEFLKGFTIATTTNGGKTWNEQPLDTNIIINWTWDNFSCFDINHIWLTSWPGIYYSSDAGRTWQMKTSLLDTLSPLPYCLSFQDSLNGFAGEGGLAISKTTDGGKKWNQVHNIEVNDGNYDLHHIAFSGPKNGIAVGAEFQTMALRTNDGGINWTKDSGNATIYHAVAPETPKSLSYPDPKHAFLSTLFGYLYGSSDSGKTWNQIGEREPLGATIQSISFFDSARGIAVVSDTSTIIGYTSDGGKSWQKFPLPTSINDFWFSSFPDSSVAYIAAGNRIYRLNTSELSVGSLLPSNDSESLLELVGDAALITIPDGFSGEVRIVDLLGRTLKNDILTIGKTRLSLHGLPSQVFIEVRWKDQFKVFKVLH